MITPSYPALAAAIMMAGISSAQAATNCPTYAAVQRSPFSCTDRALALDATPFQPAAPLVVIRSNGSNFPGAADLPDNSSLRIGGAF